MSHFSRKAAPLTGLATLAALGIAFVLPQPAQAQTTIDTFPDFTGPFVHSETFGSADSGEWFTVPADNILTSFTYAVSNANPDLSLRIYNFIPPNTPANPLNSTFLGVTYDSALFTGVPTTGPTPITLGGTNGFVYSFDTGMLPLKTGNTYLALLHNVGQNGGGVLGENVTDAYPDGSVVVGPVEGPEIGGEYLDVSQVPGVTDADAAFKATFVSPSAALAPELSPAATVGVVALFAAGLLLRARKRKA